MSYLLINYTNSTFKIIGDLKAIFPRPNDYSDMGFFEKCNSSILSMKPSFLPIIQKSISKFGLFVTLKPPWVNAMTSKYEVRLLVTYVCIKGSKEMAYEWQ